MAKSNGAEVLGAAGYATRGPVSAAAAIGCALINVGSDQLGFSSAAVALLSGATFSGPVTVNSPFVPGNTHQLNIVSTNGSASLLLTNTGSGGSGFAFQSVADTGYIWNYASAPIVFGVGNAEAVRINADRSITASSSVGIGMAPTYRLTVKQAANTSYLNGFGVENSADDSVLVFAYNGTLGAFKFNATYTTSGAYKPITFFTSDIERVRIAVDGTATLNGNVLLGGSVIQPSTSGGAALGAPTNKFTNLYLNGDANVTTVTAGGNVRAKTTGTAGTATNLGLQIGAFNTGFFENNAILYAVYNGSTKLAIESANFTFRSDELVGWASGSPDSTTQDLKLARNAAGQLDVRGNSGFRVRNLANTADADISCSALVASGLVTSSGFRGPDIKAPDNDSTFIVGKSYRTIIQSNNSNIVLFDGGVNQPTYLRAYGSNYDLALADNGGPTTFGGLVSVGAFTIGTLPNPASHAGRCARVTDGGQKLVYSNGTIWLYVHDNSAV